MSNTAVFVRAQMTNLFAQAFTNFVSAHADTLTPSYCRSMFGNADESQEIRRLPRLLDIRPTSLMSSNHRNAWAALSSSTGNYEATGISSRARESARYGKVNFDIQWALVQGIIYLAAAEADRAFNSTDLDSLHAEMASLKAKLFGQKHADLNIAEVQLASAALCLAKATDASDYDSCTRKFAEAAEAFSYMQWSSSAAMLYEITAEMFEQSLGLSENAIHARLQAAMFWLESDVNREHTDPQNRANAIRRGIVNGMIGDPDKKSGDVDGLLWVSANLHLDRDQCDAAFKDLVAWGYRMLLRREPLDDDHMSNIVVSLQNLSDAIDYSTPGAESLASAADELARLADEIAYQTADPEKRTDVEMDDEDEGFVMVAVEEGAIDDVKDDDIDVEGEVEEVYELIFNKSSLN